MKYELQMHHTDTGLLFRTELYDAPPAQVIVLHDRLIANFKEKAGYTLKVIKHVTEERDVDMDILRAINTAKAKKQKPNP